MIWYWKIYNVNFIVWSIWKSSKGGLFEHICLSYPPKFKLPLFINSIARDHLTNTSTSFSRILKMWLKMIISWSIYSSIAYKGLYLSGLRNFYLAPSNYEAISRFCSSLTFMRTTLRWWYPLSLLRSRRWESWWKTLFRDLEISLRFLNDRCYFTHFTQFIDQDWVRHGCHWN